ncbi:hypothetical protein EDC96DRAFT_482616 [Choanephora cucurbitarum]|nr:hypothetical protein EDC96DRAFT_482616 [Choanephora cucurbitarum]
MAISLVYLTWLCQYTLDRNAEGGARAAAAGSVILIIVQFIWALELTAPGGGTRMSGGSWGAAGNGATNFGQRFTNAVRPAGGAHHGHHNKNYNKELPRHGVNDEESIGDGSSVGDFEQATALHSYQASAEDPNELSFSKNEVLDILDKRGNWWQARKQDGTTGIVPSNYVSLYCTFVRFK